jgi:hypothetical protein
MGAVRPLTVALVGAAALVLAACGGNKAAGNHPSVTTTGVPTTQRGTTGTTVAPGSSSSATGGPTSSSVTATAGASTTSKATPSTLADGQPAGGPVPAGFDPVSFTAVSAQEFWLLGDAPCGNPVCTSIVRTTNGGTTFAGTPAPAAPLDVSSGSSGGVNTLRFANPLDGYAYDTNPGGTLWDTHDGGEHWSQPTFLAGRQMLAFGTGARYAFALVGACGNGSCSTMTLERSPVSSDRWAPEPARVPAGADPIVAMAVHGANVWISVTTSQSQPNQLLLAGAGSGASFGTYKSPCYSGLGGELAATSAQVVWAVCPTGMLAGLWRSTDAGAQWQQLSAVGELPNSAILAPASDTDAVVAPSPDGSLLITTNGGVSWTAVHAGSPGYSWSWVGFTDAATGSALRAQGSSPAGWPWPNGPSPEQLWRTSDGGASWSGPVTVG